MNPPLNWRAKWAVLEIALFQSGAVIASAVFLTTLKFPLRTPPRYESEGLRPENLIPALLEELAWYALPGIAVWCVSGFVAGFALGRLSPDEERGIGWTTLRCSVIPFLLLLLVSMLVPANGIWVFLQGTGFGGGPVAAVVLSALGRRLARNRR